MIVSDQFLIFISFQAPAPAPYHDRGFGISGPLIGNSGSGTASLTKTTTGSLTKTTTTRPAAPVRSRPRPSQAQLAERSRQRFMGSGVNGGATDRRGAASQLSQPAQPSQPAPASQRSVQHSHSPFSTPVSTMDQSTPSPVVSLSGIGSGTQPRAAVDAMDEVANPVSVLFFLKGLGIRV